MDRSLQPWGAEEPPAREPIFNAPWPATVVVLAIIGAYVVQVIWGGGEAAALRWGFAPADLARGRWGELIAMMFIHGGWPHAIMNALGALAFGPPVARWLGVRLRGALAFFAFYLVCGVISGLGYAALHPSQMEPVIGASGAVSGLMGAASRLFGRQEGLNPLTSSPVVSLAAGWVLVNAIMAVFGAGVLAGGARIAWEAHIAGFVAGVLLIGPWRRLGEPEAPEPPP
jgi:membrane associated rhomboid family serine protease